MFDLDRWRDAVHESPRMAVINFPHNPTGKMISSGELQQMVEHCEHNDCWLFSDEVFRDLKYRLDDRLPPVVSLYRKGLSLGVMSKARGLPGVRVGWIACRDIDLIARMLEIKRYLSICNGRTDELLATIALQHATVLLLCCLSQTAAGNDGNGVCPEAVGTGGCDADSRRLFQMGRHPCQNRVRPKVLR